MPEALSTTESQRDGNLLVSMLSTAPVTAVFVITFCILVTIFAINRTLRYFCGSTKPAAVLGLAHVLFAVRARWSFPMGWKGAALIIAAAAYATPYFVAALCYAVSSDTCTSVAGGIIAAATVIAVVLVAGLGSSTPMR